MEERDIRQVLADVAAAADEQEVSVTEKRRYRSRRPAIEPSQVYSIRLPVSSLRAIRQLADDRGEAPTSMLRTWVLDRLSAETRKVEQASIKPLKPAGRSHEHVLARDVPTEGFKLEIIAAGLSGGGSAGEIEMVQSARYLNAVNRSAAQ